MGLNKRRMVVVSHSLSRTGAPRVALDIARYFQKELKVIVLSVDANTSSKWEVGKNITVVEMPKSIFSLDSGVLRLMHRVTLALTFKRFGLKELWYLLFIIRVRPWVVVHNTMFHGDLQRISNALRLKAIRYLHEDIIYLKGLSQKDVDTFNKGFRTVGCSQSVIKASRSIGIEIDSICLPAQVDGLMRVALKSRLRAGSEKRVLSVGGGGERKGADLAEKIAMMLPAGFVYDWYGLIVDVSFRRVGYKGNVTEVPYSEYGIFALTSRSEPWGIAALEALAHGLVIVGWEDLPLIVELSKYNLAFSIPRDDICSFALRIEHCKERSQNMNAVREFLSRYTSDKLYGKTLTDIIWS